MVASEVQSRRRSWAAVVHAFKPMTSSCFHLGSARTCFGFSSHLCMVSSSHLISAFSMFLVNLNPLLVCHDHIVPGAHTVTMANMWATNASSAPQPPSP